MSTQRVILQLHLQDSEGQWHVLHQTAELPTPVLPGIFLANAAGLGIPRIAPEGAPIDTVIKGIILDVVAGSTICVLPALQAAAYTLDEWLTQHPRWSHTATEPPQDDKPDWLKEMGEFEGDQPLDGG